MPLISVVIPVYNRPDDLRRALDSLRAQTFLAFEVVVCDDGSTADIRSVVEGFSSTLSVRYLRIDNSGGPARPRNHAIQHTSGEWVAFLDSDDWWDPDRLAQVSVHLDDEIDLLYHPLRLIGPKGLSERGGSRTVGMPIVGDALRFMAVVDNPIPNSAAVVRRECLERIAGFCEERELIAYEDFDAWLRLAEMGARFRFLPKALGYYWLSIDAISSVSPEKISRQMCLYRRHAPHFVGFEREALAKQHYTLASLWRQVVDGELAALEHFSAARGVVGRRRRLGRFAQMAKIIFRKPTVFSGYFFTRIKRPPPRPY